MYRISQPLIIKGDIMKCSPFVLPIILDAKVILCNKHISSQRKCNCLTRNYFSTAFYGLRRHATLTGKRYT